MTDPHKEAVERVFRIRDIIDAVTDKVLSYRPVDKGLAAKKTKRKLARKSASQKRLQNRDKDRG